MKEVRKLNVNLQGEQYLLDLTKFYTQQQADGKYTGVLWEETLAESSDGITGTYPLQYRPSNSSSVFLFINGLLRTEYTLVDKNLILNFIPTEGSKIFVRYFVGTVASSAPTRQVDLERLLEFMDTFIYTNKVLTMNDQLLTKEGEYITVDIDI